MIKVSGLTKTYRAGKRHTVALDDVYISLGNSGMVFLLGKSGCGKTTFLNMLGAMDTFDCGKIEVDGRELSCMTARERDAYRNTYVGFVFQEYNLIDDFNVEQNIVVAQELQRREPQPGAVSALLESLGLKGLEKRKVSELSSGQRQRVAVARVLIKNPRLLLCDEPTGALDSESGENLMMLLKEISRDRLVVVVTHDRDFAERYGDRIIELKDGKVISDSAASECKDNKENLTLTFARLKTKRAFAMGARTAIKKPLQLVTSVLLLTITVCMLGMSCLIATFDNHSAIKRTIYNVDRPYTVESASFVTDGTNIGRDGETSVKLLMDDGDLTAYEERFGLSCMGAVDEAYYFGGNVGENAGSTQIIDGYYFNSCTALTQDIIEDFGFELVGAMPVEENEIVISNYVLRIFIKEGYNDGKQTFAITAAQDMIGKTLNFSLNPLNQNNFTVCGVIVNLDYDNESLEKAIEDTSEYYLKDNLRQEKSFYESDYPYTWLFVSPEMAEGLKSACAEENMYMNAGLLNDSFMRGEWGDTYVRWAGRERNSLIIYEYGSPKYTDGISGEMPFYDSLTEGQCLLGLNELFAVVTTYDDIYLDGSDRALYDCDTLNEYINKYYFSLDKISRIIESDYSYLVNDRYTLEDRASEFYRALMNGDYVVYGEVPIAEILWNDISDVVQKYAAGMRIAVGGTSARATEFELAGVVIDVDDNLFHEGALVLTRGDAEALTYGAFGNYYSTLVSAMPKDRNEMYDLYDDGISTSYGLHYVMHSFEENAVADFMLQLTVAQQLCGIVCVILAVFACILLFNFIVASLKIRENDLRILKNLGAGRAELFKIFLSESLLTVLLGFVLGVICVAVGIWAFNRAYASIIHPSLVALQFEWFVPPLILGSCLLVVFLILGFVTLVKKSQ